MEANPEDITEEKAREWRSVGINRLSVGVQSFDDAALAFMGRRHSGSEAVWAVEILSQAGFSRISLDLIYGVPGRSDAALGRELETAVGLGVEHISAYALTREAGTAWDVGIARRRMPAADDEMASRQYFQVVDALERAGYSRYEVSNFARPGARSRHNSAYWSGAPYLGIGPVGAFVRWRSDTPVEWLRWGVTWQAGRGAMCRSKRRCFPYVIGATRR